MDKIRTGRDFGPRPGNCLETNNQDLDECRANDEDIEFQAQVAAWLFDKMHFKQEQIAEHLGIRQPDVSRRLKTG